MLDPKTGRITWDKEKELWLGMSHREFKVSTLYQHDLLEERYIGERYACDSILKDQMIDGFPMRVRLRFDQRGLLSRIVLSHHNQNAPSVPHHEVKIQNDRFLAEQLKKRRVQDRPYEFSWGTIASTTQPETGIIVETIQDKSSNVPLYDKRPIFKILEWHDEVS